MRILVPMFLVGVLFAGCRRAPSSHDEELLRLNDKDRFLVLQGVIRQGSTVSVTHAKPGVYPSETLAYANAKLGPKIRDLTGDFRAECFIVPTVSGYDVIILATRNLTDSESAQMRTYVDEVLQWAQKETEAFRKKE